MKERIWLAREKEGGLKHKAFSHFSIHFPKSMTFDMACCLKNIAFSKAKY